MSELSLMRPVPTAGTDRLVSWAPVMYVVATAVGLVMRLMLVGFDVPIPFDHLLHAHSHALYFGWAGLVVLSAAFSLDNVSSWVVAAAWMVPVMAVAFLAVGYAAVSIAVSTAVMFAWYGAIRAWWRAARRRADLEATAFRIGFGYVVLASVGIWVLAGVQATGWGGSLASRLAVHSFLSTFGWFFIVGSVGLVARHRLVDVKMVRRALLWWAVVAWLGFPLGVAGGPEVPVLGPVSRLAGLVVVYPGWLWMRELWRSGISRSDTLILRGSVLWLGVKTVADVAVALGGSDVLEMFGRHGVVLYLHATLLGYVTTVFAWHLAQEAGVAPVVALLAHLAGTAIMVGGLLIAALASGGFMSLATAAFGAFLIWVAGIAWSVPVWRGLRR